MDDYVKGLTAMMFGLMLFLIGGAVLLTLALSRGLLSTHAFSIALPVLVIVFFICGILIFLRSVKRHKALVGPTGIRAPMRTTDRPQK